ncbi:hypothetical protein ACFE04_019429 [Oxalis oulophora]
MITHPTELTNALLNSSTGWPKNSVIENFAVESYPELLLIYRVNQKITHHRENPDGHVPLICPGNALLLFPLPKLPGSFLTFLNHLHPTAFVYAPFVSVVLRSYSSLFLFV